MINTKANLKNVTLGQKYNSDLLPTAYSSPRYCTKPHVVCRLCRRTTACFNCVRGSLEALVSRKVLQVLASVLQDPWALANVCRLMRRKLQRLLSLVLVKTKPFAMPTFYFSRFHIVTSRDTNNKIDLLLTGLRNDARTDFRGYFYKFFNSEIIEIQGKEYITGELVKYNPDDVEEVVDASERKLQDVKFNNKVVGKARYIIDSSSSILMFNDIPGVISKQTFVGKFVKLFEMNYDNYFIELHVSPIKEQYSFIEKIRAFRTVKKIIINLVPSNPNFADRWRSVDERLRGNHISKYKEVQENNIPGQSIVVDDETENKFLMSEDGYGDSVANGTDADGTEKTITTKESNKQVNKNVPADLNKMTDVLLFLSETLNEIVKRTQK